MSFKIGDTVTYTFEKRYKGEKRTTVYKSIQTGRINDFSPDGKKAWIDFNSEAFVLIPLSKLKRV